MSVLSVESLRPSAGLVTLTPESDRNQLLERFVDAKSNMNTGRQRITLQRIARRAMTERGLLPEFSREATAELDRIQVPSVRTDGAAKDLRACHGARSTTMIHSIWTSSPSPRLSRTARSRSSLPSRTWTAS